MLTLSESSSRKVLSPGVEPGFSPSEGDVLSIERWERVRKRMISQIIILFEKALASFAPKSSVDLARIELAPLQCECSIVPLDYRPIKQKEL